LLTQGALTRQQSLEAQRTNLHRFHRDNAELFASMPYEPWTLRSGFREARTHVAPSLLPGADSIGLLEVFMDNDLPARNAEQHLLMYPGLLMTETLHNLFATQYLCPTALGLPSLQYLDRAGVKQSMLVVGDPVSHGTIVNDGHKCNKEGQHAQSPLRPILP